MESIIAIDTETTGAYLHHGCKPFIVSACDIDENKFCWSFRVNPKTRNPIYDKKTLTDIWDTISNYDNWVFHNALFDLTALSLLPFRNQLYEKLETVTVDDTMVMAHCHNSLDRLGLKGLCLLYLNMDEDDEKALDEAVTYSRRIAKKEEWAIAEPTHPHLRPLKEKKGKCDFWLPREVYRRIQYQPHYLDDVAQTYATIDAERTIGLYYYLRFVLEERKDLEYHERHRPCILPTWRLQQRGLNIKTGAIPRSLRNLISNRTQYLQKLQADAKNPQFNPRSSLQLPAHLYDTLKLPVPHFTGKGAPSTDKDAVEALLSSRDLTQRQTDFLQNLKSYRKLSTAINYTSSYDLFMVKDKLYPSLNISGTRTLRLACRNPNTQNISKQENDEDHQLDKTVSINLRELFGPPKRKAWICVDYQQLQLVIFAYASNDQYLIDSFRQGLDVHQRVAEALFSTASPTSLQRRAAKAVNFGIIFGAGPGKLKRLTGLPDANERFRAQFPNVTDYIKKCERDAKRLGYIRTMGGYPLHVPKKSAYKACNYVVQGTEGELIKIAITDCEAYCSNPEVPFYPVMTVHDEIIFETKNELPKGTTELPKDHLLHLTEVEKIMVAASAKIGVVTGVDHKVTFTHWAAAS